MIGGFDGWFDIKKTVSLKISRMEQLPKPWWFVSYLFHDEPGAMWGFSFAASTCLKCTLYKQPHGPNPENAKTYSFFFPDSSCSLIGLDGIPKLLPLLVPSKSFLGLEPFRHSLSHCAGWKHFRSITATPNKDRQWYNPPFCPNDRLKGLQSCWVKLVRGVEGTLVVHVLAGISDQRLHLLCQKVLFIFPQCRDKFGIRFPWTQLNTMRNARIATGTLIQPASFCLAMLWNKWSLFGCQKRLSNLFDYVFISGRTNSFKLTHLEPQSVCGPGRIDGWATTFYAMEKRTDPLTCAGCGDAGATKGQ